MYHHTISTKCNGFLSPPVSLKNPNPNPIFTPKSLQSRRSIVFNCRGIEVSSPNPLTNSARLRRDIEGGERLRGVEVKEIDVVTLGNLCVDIVLSVPKLPPVSFDDREDYREELSKSPPDKEFWEAGGNCNMAIAAARLGLHCSTIGHVGDEIYGRFLVDVLHDEGIDLIGMTEDNDAQTSSIKYETLLCWVLVDPLQRHDFCSRADFSKDPAYSWITKLSSEVKTAIKKSKVLFCNGYGFDEFSPGLITSAMEYAVQVGTAIFFDPGPKGKSLSRGTPEERKAFNKLLTLSDVLLITSEEAESLTGMNNPILAGKELLRKGLRTKWVIIKLGSKGSILITMSSISCAPAFKVNVIDTVGCGDSYVAAIAFGFIHNMPLVYALTIANAVGAATALGSGAGRNVANLNQVLDLMKAANLNEDDKFWKELLDRNFNADEIITFLSGTVVSGNSNKLNYVPLTKVVSEILPKLESTRGSGKLRS